MTEKFKQERPSWCPHNSCKFKRISQDKICGGDLPEHQPHDVGGPLVNTYRFCLKNVLPNKEIFDLQVNDNDLQFFRWIFDSLDGKKTSWLSS